MAWSGLDELYDYVYDQVRAVTPSQTPGKWTFGMEGELYIARRGRPVTTPAPLPSELRQAIDSPLAGVRGGAVQELAAVLRGSHAGRALAARLALEQLTSDDSRAVAAAATAALAASAPATPAPATPAPAHQPRSHRLLPKRRHRTPPHTPNRRRNRLPPHWSPPPARSRTGCRTGCGHPSRPHVGHSHVGHTRTDHRCVGHPRRPSPRRPRRSSSLPRLRRVTTALPRHQADRLRPERNHANRAQSAPAGAGR